MPIINSAFFGSGGADTSDATATASRILAPYTAYVASGKVTGTMPSQGAQIITPGTSNQTIASGRYLSGTQTILGDADLVPGNIKAGVNIFGVAGALEIVTYLTMSNGEITINSGSNTIRLQGEWTFATLHISSPFGGVGLLLVQGVGGVYIPGYATSSGSYNCTSETSAGVTIIGLPTDYDIVFPNGIADAYAFVWNE